MLNKRAKNLVDTLGKDFQAAIIQTQSNRFYFLDFDTDDAGTLLILPDKMVFIIDTRYTEAAAQALQGVEIVQETSALEQAHGILQEAKVQKLLAEDGIPVAMLTRMQGKMPGVDIVADSTLTAAVTALRLVKDEEEIARMRQAQRITDDCFSYILPRIKEGMREVDIMLDMEHFMRAHGAEKVAFDTICVADPKTSLPHGVPGENTVKSGCFITMDFGASYKGYCADMTRTVAFGEVSDEHKKVYDLVLRAHLAGIAAARAGRTGREVDAAARDLIAAEGYGEYFGHGLGHGVGIDIHEEPRYSPRCEDVVPAGAVMTIEPGVYLPGRFGCRIEDMILVGEEGCEPLPTSPKELIVLGV